MLFLDVQTTNFPVLLLPVFFLFFTINYDVFSRELDLNITDFLLFGKLKFRHFIVIRTSADMLLMTVPVVISSLVVLIVQLLTLEIDLVSLVGQLVILTVFSSSWFLLCASIFLFLKRKVNNSFVSIFSYLIIIFGLFLVFGYYENLRGNISNVFSILIGINLSPSPVLSLVVSSGLGLLSSVFLVDGLKRWEEKINRLTTGEEIINNNFHLKFSYDSSIFHPKISIKRFFSSFYNIYLIFVVFFTILILLFLDLSDFLLVFSVIIGLHVLITHLSLLLMLPSIVAEKGFNMEEILLSKISTLSYFSLKYFFLLQRLISGIALPMITVFFYFVLFSNNQGQNLITAFFNLFVLLLVKGLFFISLLMFLWRLLPIKNTLNNSIITISSLEILVLVFGLLVVPSYALVLSPTFPTLFTCLYFRDITLVTFSFPFYFSGGIILTLGSYVLTRSEIRYQ